MSLLLGIVVRYRRKVVETRIAKVFPHVHAAARSRIARDAYVHLGLTLLWFLRLPSLSSHEIAEELIDFDGDADGGENRRCVSLDGMGNAIVTTGHVGKEVNHARKC